MATAGCIWFSLHLGNVIQCERRSEPLVYLDRRSSDSDRSSDCWGLILLLVRRADWVYCSDPLTGYWILSLSDTGWFRNGTSASGIATVLDVHAGSSYSYCHALLLPWECMWQFPSPG